ncbi:MAG TPA: glycosyltransferase family 2 protein [Thermoanaerobaculia bacterium]
MISVVVVSFEARDHLRRCLETLEAQSGTWGEVIVVDNASEDGSAEMVADDFPWCRLLRLGANAGFGAANNRGAALARGETLLLLNSDAWLAGGALALLAARLAADPGLAAVVPQLYFPDGRPQFAWCPETGVVGEAIQMRRNRFEARRWSHRRLRRILRALTGPGWYTAACMLLRKAAFDAVGGFDEGFFLYFEDVDLSRRLRRAGWKMALVDDASAFHVKGGSRRGGAGEVAYREAQLRYYRKHRPAWEQRYLRRRMRRKFARVREPELRARLLGLLDA